MHLYIQLIQQSFQFNIIVYKTPIKLGIDEQNL